MDNVEVVEQEIPRPPEQVDLPDVEPEPTPAELTFRIITYEDIDLLWEWENGEPGLLRAWSEEIPTESYVEFNEFFMVQFFGASGQFWIVEEDGNPIGFVGLSPILPSRTALAHMLLRPGSFGRGTEIAREAIEQAKELGIRDLSVAMRRDYPRLKALLRFWRMIGFQKSEQVVLVLRLEEGNGG